MTTMHYQFDMYTLDRVDTSPTPLDWRTMVRWLCGFLGFSAIMFYFGSTYPCYPPVGPKQYPYNNLYLEKGGDPAVQPEPVKHYEL
ncbi:hypothetical protein DNTS_009013 [Danionella cerebrum]|uniref:NADH dehydrogenase [ubiquinone] 1 beta subcomplex subunit 8, mitochondrial n=1 Tax=Danionella cerebrum TaxID=2873325 RepID=A0A553QAC0_9TELE|nr:hypothetical protein DNTS_009013 [Danionella translucida]